MLLHEEGALEDAESCFRRLLQAEPGDVEALFHLGALLQKTHRLDEALGCFRRALAAAAPDAPIVAQLWLRIGQVEAARYDERGFEDAASSLAQALALEPSLAEAHASLAHLRGLQDRHPEAIAHYEAALRLDPAAASCRADWLNESQRACDWRRLDELFPQVRADAVAAVPPVSPFALLSLPTTAAEQLLAADHFARAAAQAGRAPQGSRPPSRGDGKIRVGYLSANFNVHAVAFLAAELFELHDRRRFEVRGYSVGPDDGSPIRARLVRAFDAFRDLRDASPSVLFDVIRGDGIDILVDLMGYTFRGRPEVLAHRPAAVQVNFLGYPGTTGRLLADYVVGDAFVTPASHAAHFGEQIVRLPGCYQPNDRRRPRPPAPSRSDLGLPPSAFVFCAFNQPYKILPEVFGSWMRMLQAVPSSVLWLLEFNRWMAPNLRREAAARGVDPARLVFAPMWPLERHLSRLAAADLFLDTFPYTAHTTGSDALWTGLPLLTRAGETFASRVAGSLLHAVGLEELITWTPEAYESLGISLARDPGRLGVLRDRLAGARERALLFDAPRFARHLEQAYDVMWRRSLAGEPPSPIDIA